MKKRIHSSLVETHKLLSFTSCVICPGSGSHTGKAEGTFDASALPAGSAFNVFSSPTAIDLVDVNFSHTVSANEDLSILTLTEGQFTINAGNGDQLQGTYEGLCLLARRGHTAIQWYGRTTRLLAALACFSEASGSGFWSGSRRFHFGYRWNCRPRVDEPIRSAQCPNRLVE